MAIVLSRVAACNIIETAWVPNNIFQCYFSVACAFDSLLLLLFFIFTARLGFFVVLLCIMDVSETRPVTLWYFPCFEYIGY